MSETATPGSTESVPVSPAPERPAHRDANVLRWIAAYTMSMVGDSVYFMALAWSAARSGSPTQAGVVLAVGAVPRAVLMLGGGVLADRWGPRRVVIGSDAARCLVILGIAATLLLTAPGLWPLIAVALVFGALDALFLPAVGALPPRITTHGQLARVQGLRGLGARVANVTGGPARRAARRVRRARSGVRRGGRALRRLAGAAHRRTDDTSARPHRHRYR